MHSLPIPPNLSDYLKHTFPHAEDSKQLLDILKCALYGSRAYKSGKLHIIVGNQFHQLYNLLAEAFGSPCSGWTVQKLATMFISKKAKHSQIPAATRIVSPRLILIKNFDLANAKSWHLLKICMDDPYFDGTVIIFLAALPDIKIIPLAQCRVRVYHIGITIDALSRNLNIEELSQKLVQYLQCDYISLRSSVQKYKKKEKLRKEEYFDNEEAPRLFHLTGRITDLRASTMF